jgi:membrane-bound metal-dependent hydrolase YbcI (DUF457 family)
MPFTPYHFGPSAFFGLVFRKYIDIPVFLLANIAVDIEVLVINLLGLGWPVHRYVHNLLIGAAVGAVWGLSAYPLRNLFKKIMQLIRLPYQATLLKMIISGILGIWLHVLIDAPANWDIRLFWPSKIRPLWHLLTEQQTKAICLAFLLAAVIVYLYILAAYIMKQNNTIKKKDK